MCSKYQSPVRPLNFSTWLHSSLNPGGCRWQLAHRPNRPSPDSTLSCSSEDCSDDEDPLKLKDFGLADSSTLLTDFTFVALLINSLLCPRTSHTNLFFDGRLR